MPKTVITLLFSLLIVGRATAQSSVEEFRLGAAAQILNDECIRLTPDVPYVSGSAWYENAMNLNESFELTVCLVFGEKNDDGADGIVFVFHPSMQTGYRGEGMGFAGLYPSFGIEFDTYQNRHLQDPEADHLAIMPHGRAGHYASLVGPISLPNLEDGNKHLLRILWQPDIMRLEVHVDRKLRASYDGDLVGEIFGGNSTIYWGVTAATGRLSNYQDICIKKIVYAGVE